MANARSIDAASLEAWLAGRIAPARSLGVTIERAEPLTIAAPLAANINDKGTAFAGSLFSVAALAGWLHLTRWCAARALEAQVALQRADAQFLAPARAAFRATVHAPSATADGKLEAMLARRGRGRIALAIEVHCEAQLVMKLAGVYAVTRAPARR